MANMEIPAFTYTGNSTTEADENYWYIKLLSSGTLTFTENAYSVDAFLVGGGGAGGSQGPEKYCATGGGGGGYTTNGFGIHVDSNQEYTAAIGGGGSWGSGGTTSIFDLTANGGDQSKGYIISQSWAATVYGASGGSGGGGLYIKEGPGEGLTGITGGAGATNGGTASYGYAGQGTTTKPFGEDTQDAIPYSGGGGGGTSNYSMAGGYYGGGMAKRNGTANSGGGGGGRWNCEAPISGGSGLIILRGKGPDKPSILLNGEETSGLKLNGQAVSSLFLNGEKIF